MPPIEEKPFPNSAASKTKAGAEELEIGNLNFKPGRIMTFSIGPTWLAQSFPREVGSK